MNHPLAEEIEAIYYAALQHEDHAARCEYLDDACDGRGDLRQRVERLLTARAVRGDFLQSALPKTAGLASPPALEGPGASIGSYKLLEEIGEGGMGVVYMAEQTAPVRRHVALKIIKPGMDTRQVVARFEAERQALAIMDHPGIARVFDGGTTLSGRPYFVMELVRGLPIIEYCDRERLSIARRLELFVHLLRAVQHAHQKGVIHRDLKPSNVLVTVVDGAAIPKVIDFGIAKAMGASLTERTLHTGIHQFVGTPLYMSPEQANVSAVDVDTRSDVYSLGVMFYELLTGTTPIDQREFRAGELDAVRRRLLEIEPPRPSSRISTLDDQMRSTACENRRLSVRQLQVAIHGELDWIAMKALEIDRRRRYDSAAEFAADVERYLRDEPVEAHPPTRWYRFAKFARRRRRPLAVITVVGAALLAAAGLSFYQAVKATRAEHAKDVALGQARLAVDDMYTKVAEEWLEDQGALTDVQRELLEKALAFYEDFSADAEGDASARLESARARYRVGKLRHRLGDFTGALRALQRAIQSLNVLAAAEPIRAEIAIDLLNANATLARLHYDQGRKQDVAAALDNAAAQAETLAALPIEDDGQREKYAKALGRLSGELTVAGRLKDAEALVQQALPLWQELLEESPDNFEYRSALAKAHYQLAKRQMWWGDIENKAEEKLRHAKSLFEELLQDRPSDKECRKFYGAALTNLAVLMGWNNRTSEAIVLNRLALPVAESLASQFPEDLGYQDSFWIALSNLANDLDEAQAAPPEEILQLRRQALEVAERCVALNRDSLGHMRHYVQSVMGIARAAYAAGRSDAAWCYLEDADSAFRQFVNETGDESVNSLICLCRTYQAALLIDRGDHAAAAAVINDAYPEKFRAFSAEVEEPAGAQLTEYQLRGHRRNQYEAQVQLLARPVLLLAECGKLAHADRSLSEQEQRRIANSYLESMKPFRAEAEKALAAWRSIFVEAGEGLAASLAHNAEYCIQESLKFKQQRGKPASLVRCNARIFQLMFSRLIDGSAEVVADDPEQALIAMMLAAAPPEFRNDQLALRMAQRSVELAPDRAMARMSLSWAMFRSGHWKDCMEAYKKSCPQMAPINAMALWHLGRREEAWQAFEDAASRLEGVKHRQLVGESKGEISFPPYSQLSRLYAEAEATLAGEQNE